jgi:hypothetical protein
MRKVGHFLGGREVYTTSGRFGEVLEPMTCDVQVALSSKSAGTVVEKVKAAQSEPCADEVSRIHLPRLKQLCQRPAQLMKGAYNESARAEHAG